MTTEDYKRTTCVYCNGSFGHSHQAKLYCSNACKLAAWKAANPDKHRARQARYQAKPVARVRTVCPVYAGFCLACQHPFVSRRKRRYCSEACHPSSEYVSIAPASRDCTLCGQSYRPTSTGGRPSEYCSAACLGKSQAAVKRVHKAKRKAMIRRATVERVDPFVVFDRDKWACRLCGRRTPKAKRGTYDDDAPELDHIQPLAKGGAHSYANTQCACRKCNLDKSDRPLGQLLLIG